MRREICCAAALILAAALLAEVSSSQDAELLSRDKLIADVRQLVSTLESVHPDPYINGGGKIAFHRRAHEIMRAIPEEGMTREEFYRLMLPFVAAVRDGHTRISLEDILASMRNPLGADSSIGLPLGLEIVDQSIFVKCVYRDDLKHLLGAVISSVEGVSFAELVERQKKMRGYDNYVSNLFNIMLNLNSREGMQSILPEWKYHSKMIVEFRLPCGELDKREIEIVDQLPEHSFEPPSKIELPSIEKSDPSYGFLGGDKKIGILRVDSMSSYREAFESLKMRRSEFLENWARIRYRQFNKAEPPEDVDELLAGIPAASATFKSLVEEMKEAGTETLIIDISRNRGGNSLLSDILIYFLYGWDAYEAVNKSYAIVKYSDLNIDPDMLQMVNEGKRIPLEISDYDFDLVLGPDSGEAPQGVSGTDMKKRRYMQFSPSFGEVLKSDTYEAYYLPKDVFVITGASTLSSGYVLAADFHKLGATIVGVPSGQAGNAFGDVSLFQLDNSGLHFSVSRKRFYAFPGDPETGELLRPDYELTYDKLKEYNFDPNASVLLALEVLEKSD